MIIDGGIAGERLLTLVPGLREQRGPDGMLKVEAITEACHVLHAKHRHAWSLEIDPQPWFETFWAADRVRVFPSPRHAG